MRTARYDAKILVFYEKEEIRKDKTADCVMKLDNNKILIKFPDSGASAKFECANNQEVEIFVEQLKEAICAEAIKDIDISTIEDEFNNVETGKFYSKEILLNNISSEMNDIKNKINAANILLIRIEGDVRLIDCKNIIDEISRRTEENDFWDTCTYIPEYKSNTARVSIWYQY